MKRTLRSFVFTVSVITAMNTCTFATGPLPLNFTLTQAGVLSPVKDDTVFEKPAPANAKTCACQLLNVNSKNQRNLQIALLVEKASVASAADRSLIKLLFEREKRYMKFFFYEEMKMVGNMTAAMDCKSLYKKLQSSNNDLQLYQVLDADVKSATALR